ncbi:MAG: hypothetical protein SF187_09230 [Deltaproteobacteria bacterium]|nr:hypothetical protein [Deltaproteobacteria bacterium]
MQRAAGEERLVRIKRALIVSAAVFLVFGATSCDGDGTLTDGNVPSSRNLKVTVSRSVDQLGPGDDVEITLVAENVGTGGDLRDIEVLVPLSRSLDPIRWTGDLGSRQNIAGAPTNLSIWTLKKLSPGQRATHKITLQARAGDDVVAYNGALAFAQNEEGSLLDNGSISLVPVSSGQVVANDVNLRLRAAGPGNPIKEGEVFAIRMTIDNLNVTDTAHDVLLLGLLDPRVEFDTLKPATGAAPVPPKRTFSWQLKQIPGGSQAWMEMHLRAKQNVDLSETADFFTSAFLAAREADPDLSDNWILLGSHIAK